MLIGEMRDLETIESALRIAETGHLTFATLHTNSAAQTINRIIDVFPAHQQSQVRAQLSLVLEGIMCQTLLPRASGSGRVLAIEILVPNPAIRNLIREDKIHQIYSTMQTGQEKYGMQTFNQSLASLYFAKQITLQTALGISSNPEELQDMINRGAGLSTPQAGGRPPTRPRAASSGRSNDACIRLEGQDAGRQGRLRRAGRRQQGRGDAAAAARADRGLVGQGEGERSRCPSSAAACPPRTWPSSPASSRS